jgi:aryl-alcohol dehydrogenase-like predicted oxidoreductase
LAPARWTVARLGFGTAPFGYGADGGPQDGATDPEALLRACLDAGIRYVDTSSTYGPAETLLGTADAFRGAGDLRVCVKIPRWLWPEGVTDALERLRLVQVDTVMFHSAVRDEILRASMPATMARARGLARACRTGVSTYGPDAARLALAQPWADAVQVEHSILNPSVVRAVAPLKRPGQEIIVRSVLCRGWLSTRRPSSAIPPEAERILMALDRLARRWGFDDLAALAIRFALDTPGVDIVLVGLASLDELAIARAAAAHEPLGAAQLAELTAFDHSTSDWTHPERWPVPA